jgi:hypothetical protein
MAEVLILTAAVMWFAVVHSVRLRFKLARQGRYHTRLDYKY